MNNVLKTMTIMAALLLPSLGATAQKQRSLNNVTDVGAAVKAIGMILPHYSAKDAEPLIADICERHKKNPAIYTGVADAFWYKSGTRDSTNAFRYIDKALAVNPKYAPAYLLKGDIWYNCEDTIAALNCYHKAIEADPNNTKGYDKIIIIERYRDRDKTIALIKSIKNAIPTYPVNLKIADTYVNSTKASDLNLARECYANAERDSMKARDYQNEASIYSGLTAVTSGAEKLNAYVKMFEIGEEGLKAFPNSFELTNIALVGAANSHNHPDTEKRMELDNKAVEYGEKLFAMPGADTLLTANHYMNYGIALMHKNKYGQAIDIYKRLLDLPKASDDDRSYAIGKIGEAYAQLGEYDKANDVYKDHIANLERTGRLRYYDMQTYAQMYTSKAEESVGQEQIDAYKKAAEIYGKAAEMFMEYSALAYYFQIDCLKKIDTDNSQGIALEPSKKLYNLMNAKGPDAENYHAFMQTALLYTLNHYIKIKNYKTARIWAQRYLDYDPSNEGIKNLLPKLK